MKARYWSILAGLAVVALGLQPAAASNIPLRKGQFASTVSGSFAICFDPTTFAEEPCSTPGVLVAPITLLANQIVTSDKSGNSCATVQEVDSDLPVDISPPSVSTNEHGTSTLKDYDSSAGSGDVSFIA